MTSLENFVQQPFKNEVIHRIYRESFLYMRPAPEVANGEQVLASLYRHVGFNGVSEKMVPVMGVNYRSIYYQIWIDNITMQRAQINI